MNILGITFTAPHNALFFAVYAGILCIAALHWWRSHQLITILGKTVAGKKFLHHSSILRVSIKTGLLAIALFFLFLTLLHPSWNTKEESVTQEGRDLFIALDISRSMLAQDVQPHRLECAKSKIKALVNALDSERIGLILFSGSSFVQCPLTRDKSAFFMFLNQVDVDTIASGSTALDKAIEQALAAFKNAPAQKNKLLVIFTDGEDFSSNLTTLKQQAQSQGLTIFTIGVGTAQGAPIPTFDQHGKQTGHLKDKKGNVVISQLNQGILETLASDLGGIYISCADSKANHDINQVVRLVQQREKEAIEERTLVQPEEQYPWFLLVSFMLLGAEWLL